MAEPSSFQTSASAEVSRGFNTLTYDCLFIAEFRSCSCSTECSKQAPNIVDGGSVSGHGRTRMIELPEERFSTSNTTI